MGAPKLNKKAFEKSPENTKSGDLHNKQPDSSKSSYSSRKDKEAIEIYQKKIHKFVQDEQNAKKAALVIELLINKAKK